jgi:uncharacterized protein YegP (UPF0339 family)
VSSARFHVYGAKDGFRWQLLAANNRVIAESGEAYTREVDAWRAVKTVQNAVSRTVAKDLMVRYVRAAEGSTHPRLAPRGL